MKTAVRFAIALALAVSAAFAAPTAVAAHGTNNWQYATWGRAYGGHDGIYYYGSVDDYGPADNMCVELWTINTNNTRVSRLARSCYNPVSGSAWAGPGRNYGLRMYRDDGRYKTIIWPGNGH